MSRHRCAHCRWNQAIQKYRTRRTRNLERIQLQAIKALVDRRDAEVNTKVRDKYGIW